MAILQKCWFVYRTTNMITGRFYVGVHKGFVTDNYLGSGIVLKQAVKKHGKECFTREIVALCDSPEAAYELEEFIIDTDFVSREDTYNLAIGGRGRLEYPTKLESKLKMRKPKSKEHCEAISKGKLGVKLTEEHVEACRKGREGFKHTEATKLLMSEKRSNIKHKVVECPHCGKTGGHPAMKQWHFNNCKQLGEIK